MSLVVSCVQETFGYKNLFYLPGSYFSTNIDLLTRYDVKILSKISQDFFQPPFLMPELEDRVTVKVENMRKTADLPHTCEKQQIWTQMKGSSQMLTGNLLEKTATTSNHTKGYHSTGRWGLQRKQKCHPEKTCLVCGTAPLDEAPPKDQRILREAQEKHEKTRYKKLGKLLITEEIEKTQKQTETTPTSFAAASLGTFKSS